MPDRWQTYAIEFKGGLVTNLSPLQHGMQLPGSARTLRNYEPSVEGGYRRILGFSKFDSNVVPPYGTPLVHGGSQSGTTLIIGNLFTSPVAGDTLTVAGVSGTYTIASSGVSYSSTNKRATLTLTTSLNSSPADQAAVTFTSGAGTMQAVATHEDIIIAARGSDLFKSSGSGWTKINTPNYGTPLVNGASQTGSTLNADGFSAAPQVGDTFTIAGVNLIYTVLSTPTLSSGAAAISINPALNSSPANNAVITFLTTDRSGMTKGRFTQYNFNGTDFIAGVDGANNPFKYDTSTFTVLDGAPTDVLGASHVVNFKNQLFFAKGSSITFTAPFTDNDFSAANGAGSLNVGNTITGLIVFREQLIIFSERTISRLVGNTIADFQLQPITRDIGCIETDTIQEIGGDIMFLGPDGIRSLAATEKIGDFDLAVVSKPIQAEVTNFVNRNTSFSSVVIRKKNQYRLMGFNTNFTADSSQGVLATQTQEGLSWSELRGIRAYVADSNYNAANEEVAFAHTDGYVYSMETGNSFDGAAIPSSFATPFIPINDPRTRKTIYRMFLYTDPQGSFSATMNLKFDFEESGVIQPDGVTFDNTAGATAAAFYGESIYGSGSYGGTIQRLFDSQTIGSGNVVSIQFVSDSDNPPYSLDALTLEYGTYGRR